MGRKKDFAVTAIVDTREQLPLDLMSHGLKIERGKLDYGDYSLLVPDLRKVVAIEQKATTEARLMLAGIPFIFAENAELASFQVARMLQLIAKDVTTFAKTSLRGVAL